MATTKYLPILLLLAALPAHAIDIMRWSSVTETGTIPANCSTGFAYVITCNGNEALVTGGTSVNLDAIDAVSPLQAVNNSCTIQFQAECTVNGTTSQHRSEPSAAIIFSYPLSAGGSGLSLPVPQNFEAIESQTPGVGSAQ